MDTEHTAAATATAAPEKAAKPGKLSKAEPANRLYVFAKNCTNDHGHFAKGDKARGAFSDELVQSYLSAGVLVPKDAAA